MMSNGIEISLALQTLVDTSQESMASCAGSAQLHSSGEDERPKRYSEYIKLMKSVSAFVEV